jgi:protein-S-isoprenylcysteine O-methyltransferase Ste14
VRGRAGPLLGSLVFLVIAPGTIVGFIPYRLTHWRVEPAFYGQPWLRAPGVFLLLGGAVVLLDSFRRFALEGRGTPAPVVPPDQLVVSGLYRYVRNPMYVALLSIVLGQALLLSSTTLLWYSAMLWLMFHLFVLMYEEPTLRRTFGRSYEEYCANVSRWRPRLWPWCGKSVPESVQ